MQLVIAFCFGVSIFALLYVICYIYTICGRKETRRIESRSRENTRLPFYQTHFGNTEVEGTSTLSPSNFVQIPIEAPGSNHIESVSNPRVSDLRFLPPPSYEEVIATNESTAEPPPTYLESFFFTDYF